MEAEDETQLPIEVEEIREDAEVHVSTTETQNTVLGQSFQNHVGEASVGWRVKVYWPKMKKWYYGQVLLFDANEKTHTVFYGDWQLTDETSETEIKWCGVYLVVRAYRTICTEQTASIVELEAKLADQFLNSSDHELKLAHEKMRVIAAQSQCSCSSQSFDEFTRFY